MSLLLLVSPLFLSGCGANCGEGTMLKDGECVALADDTGTDTGDDDTDTGGGDSQDTGDTEETGETGDTGTDSGADSGDTGVDTGDTGDDTGDPPPSYTVCGDGLAPYDDLQDAIDDASDGDVVTVCAGTWDAIVIDRSTPEVTVRGLDGREDTVLDGGDEAALTMEDGTFAIEGVTLTGDADDGDAGGVWMDDGELTVSDVWITGVEPTAGSAYGYPYAVRMEGGSSTWEDVVFSENETGNGTAFVAYQVDQVVVRHCVFTDNEASPVLFSADDVEFSNNLVYGNESATSSYLMVDGTGGSAWIYNNVFYGNVYTGTNSPPQSYLVVRGDVDFQNNLFVGNEGYIYMDGGTFDYNLVYDDSDGACMGCSGNGNLTSDPKFTDAVAGDFTLKAGFSPAINAGNPLAGYNDVDGTRNDMGAFGGPNGSW